MRLWRVNLALRVAMGKRAFTAKRFTRRSARFTGAKPNLRGLLLFHLGALKNARKFFQHDAAHIVIGVGAV